MERYKKREIGIFFPSLLFSPSWISCRIGPFFFESFCLRHIEAIKEVIITFLYKDIFIVYKALLEFLIDNRSNLLAISIKYYIKLINIKYRLITLYYLYINGKVENFNSLLRKILTKYYIGKLTRV
jgi:hypothetical protein